MRIGENCLIMHLDYTFIIMSYTVHKYIHSQLNRYQGTVLYFFNYCHFWFGWNIVWRWPLAILWFCTRRTRIFTRSVLSSWWGGKLQFRTNEGKQCIACADWWTRSFQPITLNPTLTSFPNVKAKHCEQSKARTIHGRQTGRADLNLKEFWLTWAFHGECNTQENSIPIMLLQRGRFWLKPFFFFKFWLCEVAHYQYKNPPSWRYHLQASSSGNPILLMIICLAVGEQSHISLSLK